MKKEMKSFQTALVKKSRADKKKMYEKVRNTLDVQFQCGRQRPLQREVFLDNINLMGPYMGVFH